MVENKCKQRTKACKDSLTLLVLWVKALAFLHKYLISIIYLILFISPKNTRLFWLSKNLGDESKNRKENCKFCIEMVRIEFNLFPAKLILGTRQLLFKLLGRKVCQLARSELPSLPIKSSSEPPVCLLFPHSIFCILYRFKCLLQKQSLAPVWPARRPLGPPKLLADAKCTH